MGKSGRGELDGRTFSTLVFLQEAEQLLASEVWVVVSCAYSSTSGHDRSPAREANPISPLLPQIAIEQGVDYKMCLEFVKQARSQGLKAPVLLMGASHRYSNLRSSHDELTLPLSRALKQVTSTLCSHTLRSSPFVMPRLPEPMVSSSSICHQRRLSVSASSARRRGASSRAYVQFGSQADPLV